MGIFFASRNIDDYFSLTGMYVALCSVRGMDHITIVSILSLLFISNHARIRNILQDNTLFKTNHQGDSISLLHPCCVGKPYILLLLYC